MDLYHQIQAGFHSIIMEAQKTPSFEIDLMITHANGMVTELSTKNLTIEIIGGDKAVHNLFLQKCNEDWMVSVLSPYTDRMPDVATRQRGPSYAYPQQRTRFLIQTRFGYGWMPGLSNFLFFLGGREDMDLSAQAHMLMSHIIAAAISHWGLAQVQVHCEEKARGDARLEQLFNHHFVQGQCVLCCYPACLIFKKDC